MVSFRGQNLPKPRPDWSPLINNNNNNNDDDDDDDDDDNNNNT